MTKQDELELFEYLSRQPKLKEWLQDKLVTEVSVLTQAIEVDQLRKAQGRAGILNQMLTLLDQAPAAIKRH